jgi:hypothetical protein
MRAELLCPNFGCSAQREQRLCSSSAIGPRVVRPDREVSGWK